MLSGWDWWQKNASSYLSKQAMHMQPNSDKGHSHLKIDLLTHQTNISVVATNNIGKDNIIVVARSLPQVCLKATSRLSYEAGLQ